MHKIKNYKIAWNTKSDEGIFIIETEEGIKQILVDSAKEAMVMLTKFRHEKNVYLYGGVFYTSDESLTFPKPVSHEYKIPEGVEIIAQQVSKVIEKDENKQVKDAPKKIKEQKVVAPKTTTKKKAAIKKPTRKKKATTSKKNKDNLRVIEGIGPKIEGLLNDAGIHTFLELKASKVEFLKAILEDAGARYRMHDPSTWGEQAALAATGKIEELKVLQGKLKGGKR